MNDELDAETRRKIDAGIAAGISADRRPVMSTKSAEDPRERVRLRCEAIVQMAFNVWMREVRGEAPFVGPSDMWKFNEMKNLLFSIGEDNGEFKE